MNFGTILKWLNFRMRLLILHHCYKNKKPSNYLAILHVESITDIVDLFVDLGTMMVSLLTNTGNSVLDMARMPGLRPLRVWARFQVFKQRFDRSWAYSLPSSWLLKETKIYLSKNMFLILFSWSPFVFRLQLCNLQLTQICSHKKPNHNITWP